jgi:hypothetical protein
MCSEVETLVEQVKSLSPCDQQRFRELLDSEAAAVLAPNPEEGFKQRLLSVGLIRDIKRRTKSDAIRYPRIDIQGKPLSETVTEERE